MGQNVINSTKLSLVGWSCTGIEKFFINVHAALPDLESRGVFFTKYVEFREIEQAAFVLLISCQETDHILKPMKSDRGFQSTTAGQGQRRQALQYRQ
jgi:hypothetical protein